MKVKNKRKWICTSEEADEGKFACTKHLRPWEAQPCPCSTHEDAGQRHRDMTETAQ